MLRVKNELRAKHHPMKIRFTFIHLLLLYSSLLASGLTACKKCSPENPVVQEHETLKRLYLLYSDGAIDECLLNGKPVYCGQYNNAYDGSRFVYETGGKLIAACNFRSPNPDSVCLQITNCETIYRVKDNIWGLSEVDKYGLRR